MRIIPKFHSSGVITLFTRQNGNPVAFDAEGNLTDQNTGEKGRLTTPEVVVTPTKQNWFVKALLGAAMADQPAVMTAAGWSKDDNGNYVQHRTAANDQLANNLAEISFMSPTNPVTAGIQKMIQIGFPFVKNGVLWAGAKLGSKKAAAMIGKDATSNFLKFVSNNRQKASDYSEERNQLRQMLKDNGVDVSKISEDDLATALYNRQLEIERSAPTRYGLHAQGYFPREEKITAINGNETIGQIELLKGNDRYGIGNVENYTRHRQDKVSGVSEQLYNATIQAAKSKGLKGVESGETLKSPEITANHVLPKYKDKKLVGRWGNYQWSRHNPDMVDAEDSPVWLLTKPTYQTPVKSRLFNPKIIDSLGKMHIDWSNPNIFKSLTPFFLYGIDQERDSE